MFHFLKNLISNKFRSVPSDEILRNAQKIIFEDNQPKKVSVWEDLKIIAHRGASGFAPENTLASVRKALTFSEVDMIEIDIHLSKDGEIMVIHDSDLQRTTNQKGEISELDFSEIRKANAGSWFNSKFASEKVPTLTEVLELVNGNKIVLIEIKAGKSGIYSEIVKKTIAKIREFKAEKWCIIQSFNSEYLVESHQIAPEIEIQKLLFTQFFKPSFFIDISPKKGTPKLDGITAINADSAYWSSYHVQKAHQQNYRTFVYTVNDVDTVKKAVFSGVDGIITNFPDKVIAVKKSYLNH